MHALCFVRVLFLAKTIVCMRPTLHVRRQCENDVNISKRLMQKIVVVSKYRSNFSAASAEAIYGRENLQNFLTFQTDYPHQTESIDFCNLKNLRFFLLNLEYRITKPLHNISDSGSNQLCAHVRFHR